MNAVRRFLYRVGYRTKAEAAEEKRKQREADRGYVYRYRHGSSLWRQLFEKPVRMTTMEYAHMKMAMFGGGQGGSGGVGVTRVVYEACEKEKK